MSEGNHEAICGLSENVNERAGWPECDDYSSSFVEDPETGAVVLGSFVDEGSTWQTWHEPTANQNIRKTITQYIYAWLIKETLKPQYSQTKGNIDNITNIFEEKLYINSFRCHK